jgi:hypothetical protein
MGENMAKWFFLIVLFIQYQLSSGADWKCYALTNNDSTGVCSFYDCSSIKTDKNGNKRFWTKEISKSEFGRFIKENQEDLKNSLSLKVKSKYIPPYVSQSKIADSLSIMSIIMLELAANKSNIKNESKMLYEINCKESQLRIMSIIRYDKSGSVESNSSDAGNWLFIAPETIGECLQNIICKKNNLK